MIVRVTGAGGGVETHPPRIRASDAISSDFFMVERKWWDRRNLNPHTLRHKQVCCRYITNPVENGALGRNLTCSLPVRSRLLYTFELQVQSGGSARDQTEDRAVIDRVLYQLSYATKIG